MIEAHGLIVVGKASCDGTVEDHLPEQGSSPEATASTKNGRENGEKNKALSLP
jgi:hypothetical protein